MIEFLSGESFYKSIIYFEIIPGIEANFLRRGDYFLVNYMSIFYFFFLGLLVSFILKLVRDCDFLGTIGDSIFFRTKLDISYLC